MPVSEPDYVDLCRRMSEQVDQLAEGQVERNARIRDLEAEIERLRETLLRARIALAATKSALECGESYSGTLRSEVESVQYAITVELRKNNALTGLR